MYFNATRGYGEANLLIYTGRNKRRLTLDYFASKLPFSGSDKVQPV